MTHSAAFDPANAPPTLRIAGRDATAGQVLALAVQRADAPFTVLGTPDPAADDPAQVDPALLIAQPAGPVPDPAPGLGYAGFTPEQRFGFVEWVAKPEAPAPPAFLQLYIAMLEVAAVEGSAHPPGAAHLLGALNELLRLQGAEAWRDHPLVNRALLLAHWLRQQRQAVVFLTVTRRLPAELLSLALGWQALLGETLRVQQVPPIAQTWELPAPDAPRDLLESRLRSLAADLGADPLAAALDRLGDAARQPQPWRCAHRGLRIALPPPDVRPVLQPWLAAVLENVAQAAALTPAPGVAEVSPTAEPAAGGKAANGWLLILEPGPLPPRRHDALLAPVGLRARLDQHPRLRQRPRAVQVAGLALFAISTVTRVRA